MEVGLLILFCVVRDHFGISSNKELFKQNKKEKTLKDIQQSTMHLLFILVQNSNKELFKQHKKEKTLKGIQQSTMNLMFTLIQIH